jgi:hypothetical protein
MIFEILLKVALNTITLTHLQICSKTPYRNCSEQLNRKIPIYQSSFELVHFGFLILETIRAREKKTTTQTSN